MIQEALAILALLLALAALLVMALCCILFGFDYNGATVLVVVVALVAAARLFWLRTVML